MLLVDSSHSVPASELGPAVAVPMSHLCCWPAELPDAVLGEVVKNGNVDAVIVTQLPLQVLPSAVLKRTDRVAHVL